uniref:Uncharacterized protein n=1 Tax=Romanomermis culicivorax TaxID=13658 RepID=A0A915IB56_ROMCU
MVIPKFTLVNNFEDHKNYNQFRGTTDAFVNVAHNQEKMKDSKCVLYWLKSIKALSVFVSNRIKELKTSNDILYAYVKTEENPADIATRIFDKVETVKFINEDGTVPLIVWGSIK